MSSTNIPVAPTTTTTTAGDRVEQFKTGQAIGVDISSIERELASLWRQASQSNQAVTRACSWNLIVWGGDDAALNAAKRLVDETVVSVPSRTIIVKPRPYATGTEIEAYISANCRLAPDGGKLLCTEEITIESRGKGGEHIPALLRALLVPDVPTGLWWTGAPPTEASIAKPYLSGVDRLLVDTKQTVVDGGLAKLGVVASAGDNVTVADLNWLRLGPVRSALASLFDAPLGPDMLFRLKRVKIEATHAGLPGAKLLLGWLASRLSWGAPERASERQAFGWRVPRNQGQLRVDIDVVSECTRASGFKSISLESETGEKVALSDIGHGQLEAKAATLPTRTITSFEHKDEELLVAALGARGRDKLFGVSLHRAVELER
jgi:glucose-6-phosphate dehydrogenase assembly protein OpcA